MAQSACKERREYRPEYLKRVLGSPSRAIALFVVALLDLVYWQFSGGIRLPIFEQDVRVTGLAC